MTVCSVPRLQSQDTPSSGVTIIPSALHTSRAVAGLIGSHTVSIIGLEPTRPGVPGLGTHCGLVWSEQCIQAWGVKDQISILYSINKSINKNKDTQ